MHTLNAVRQCVKQCYYGLFLDNRGVTSAGAVLHMLSTDSMTEYGKVIDIQQVQVHSGRA